MKRLVGTTLSAILLVSLCLAQKSLKPWTEWKEAEAKKLLDNSPWAHTIESFDAGQESKATTATNPLATADERLNDAVLLTKVRLLSAKPVRQAFLRWVEARQKSPNPKLTESLQKLVEQSYEDWIVIAVQPEKKDGSVPYNEMTELTKATTAGLQAHVWLQTSKGKSERVLLKEYMPPGNDGLGARFIFPRKLNGKEFVVPENGHLKFHAELPQRINLEWGFKISDLFYEGKLEY
ncbi:MAG: hypothetical protein U0Y68_22540 [Blastocatellia bacterium]